MCSSFHLTRHLLLSFVLLIQTLQAADKPLAKVAEEAAKKLPAGGLVTGESREGKVSFAAFASSADDVETYSEHTLFEIGSITKVYTGLLLAQAVVEGKVTLDTPISKLLDPKFTFADPRVAAITLKQLSTHTSGLPRLPDNLMLGARGDDPYAGYDEKLLLDFLSKAKLKEAGPYLSSYSNVGVGLLGYLMGKVYQMSWEDAVVAKICQPLGLEHTRVTVSELKLSGAKPYDGEKASVSWHLNALVGAGALHSTAADLLKFGQAMAKPEATPLAKAFALAMQPHIEVAGPSSHIGLGPFIQKRDDIIIYTHDGGTGGFRSALQVIPAQNIVRVVLINNTTLNPTEIIANTRSKPPREMPQEITLDEQLLKDYPGVYTLNQDARFTILLRKGQLWTRLTGQAFLPLSAKEKDQFFLKVVDASVHFNREEGKIISLTLFQDGRELLAKRSDQPEPKIILHTAEELKPFVGDYSLMGLEKMTLRVHGTTLFAQLAKQPAVPVFDMGQDQDRFEFDVVEAALIFNRNEKGEIIGLTLSQNGAMIPAAKVLPKK